MASVLFVQIGSGLPEIQRSLPQTKDGGPRFHCPGQALVIKPFPQ